MADICLDLIAQSKNNLSYEVITSSDFVNTASSFNFLKDLNPSLIYKEVKKHKKGIISRYYLVELFETTLPRYSIRKKIRSYLEFYYSNQWEDNVNKPFPTIKFICPTKPDLIYAKRYTKRLFEENDNPEDLHIQFATTDEVKKFGITGDIWEKVE